MSTLVAFISIIVSAGWEAIPPAVILTILMFWCARLYVRAQLPLKRLMSINRAPILANVEVVLNGLGKLPIITSL